MSFSCINTEVIFRSIVNLSEIPARKKGCELSGRLKKQLGIASRFRRWPSWRNLLGFLILAVHCHDAAAATINV